jgi:pilus assembly protein CpaE
MPTHLRVKIIANLKPRADELAQALRGAVPDAELMPAATESNGVLAAVNGSRPNLVVIDDVDASALLALSQLSTDHPDVDAIIVAREQSPQFLMAAMQAGVREVLPYPANAEHLRAAVQRIARKRGAVLHSQTSKIGKVIAFMACKGGNGASFLAANLAHTLAHRGDQTACLLDFDLQFGDGLLMLTDQRPSSNVAEVCQSIARMDASLLKASMVQVTPSLSVLSAPSDLTEALEITPAHVEAIIKQARQSFDHVVIDLSRVVNGVSLKVMDMADTIVPVMQMTLPNLRDAKRLRDLFRTLDYPANKVCWVINRHQKGGDVSVESLEQTLGIKDPVLVPNQHVTVTASVNQGVPIEQAQKAGVVNKALQQLAQRVSPMDMPTKGGWLSSIFGGH